MHLRAECKCNFPRFENRINKASLDLAYHRDSACSISAFAIVLNTSDNSFSIGGHDEGTCARRLAPPTRPPDGCTHSTSRMT